MRALALLPTLLALVADPSGPAAPLGEAKDHENCPMHAASRPEHVAKRHEHATSLPSDGIVHHFRLAPDGGSIQLETTDPAREGDRDQVRAHLKTIALAFGQGDFSTPALIHEQTPPGVETLKQRKDQVRYTFSETAQGGVVTIATRDKKALAAVHEFLRFQIEDHGTGDSASR